MRKAWAVALLLLLAFGLVVAVAEPAHAAAALSVKPDHGRPGDAITISGTNFTDDCIVIVTFDGVQLSSAGTNKSGDFELPTQVPTAAAGNHKLAAETRADCGAFASAGATFRVDPVDATTAKPPTTTATTRPRPTTTRPRAATTSTPPATSPPPSTTDAPGATTVPAPPTTTSPPAARRSTFAASIATADTVDNSGRQVATNAGIAGLLLLLIAFPAELFNKTLMEHYDEVTRWLGGPRRLFRRLATPAPVAFLAFTVLVAGISVLVDPGAGINVRTGTLAVGLVVAFVVTTVASEWPHRIWIRVSARRRGMVRIYPAALLITGMCVAVSRAAHFRPGYLFGILAGFVPIGEGVTERDEARGTFVGMVGLLAVSVAAWLAWTPVADAAAKTGASAGVLTFDALLAGVFCAGLEGLVFALLPLHFMDGHKLRTWSTPAWAVLYAVVLFVFVHVLLHPGSAFTDEAGGSPVRTTVLLFGGFAAVSVAFWARFRFRRAPEVG